jgi:hypothetical protein
MALLRIHQYHQEQEGYPCTIRRQPPDCAAHMSRTGRNTGPFLHGLLQKRYPSVPQPNVLIEPSHAMITHHTHLKQQLVLQQSLMFLGFFCPIYTSSVMMAKREVECKLLSKPGGTYL